MKSFFISAFFIASLAIQALCQSPNKMSYQAVVRNNSNLLIVNTQVGVRISILQGSAQGNPVYVETQNPFTNANGLFSIEIGGGQAVFGSFSGINWANGPYFIKNDIDLTGGTNYSITGTSQLISVPYALHAKTAEAAIETDPGFNNSPAAGIQSSDIATWNNKQDALSAGAGINITGNTISATGAGGVETDPVFVGSPAGGISNAQINAWNNKQDALIAGSGINITGNTISSTGGGSGLFTHYVGELYGGGIVVAVWLQNGVEHGLVASLTDVNAAYKWSNVTTTAVGASAQNISNGSTNTLAIIQQTGHIESAAQLCAAYNAGGFNDWYLPTYFELNICRSSAAVINSVLGNANGFKGGFYWSSVESAANRAWRFSFVTGAATSTAKTTSAGTMVRAVRRF